MSKDLISRVNDFLIKHLNQADVKDSEIQYRYEHTLRVANVGTQLARDEGANIKVVTVACLLHDVGKYDTNENREHGRVSARVARPFLETLGLSPKEINDISYAIAIHVDGEAGYDYEETIESKIVTDADNIDRFGAYRIYKYMQHLHTEQKPIPELKREVSERIERLNQFRKDQILQTKSGNEWFNKQLDLGIRYYKNYMEQLTNTSLPILDFD
ncbi:HD domain-containing protein [Haloplasma contractile]|uniref:Protein-PII uridylyltransferase n=1 Tax=Haloplasma contractile SSD-17B TaxID=1033810 RepID=F7Q1E4_9MOLU|nr:HD domain-containing protein [Haloplasma contractile]ERJ12863.1 protein-PII uridylyltransferase [Haloplasma contractile SSD-17B]